MAVQKTEAEVQLARQFATALEELPGGDQVAALRRDAIALFEREGLPHRRIEAWKYTDLRAALREVFPPAKLVDRVDRDRLAAAVGAELMALPAVRVVVVNGHVCDVEIPHELAAAGFALHRLASHLDEPGHEWMKPLLAFDGEPEQNGVLRLNTAMVTDGVVLRVEAGTNLALPIHVVVATQADRSTASTVRNLIKVDDGAVATLIESYVALSETPHQVNAVTQLDVGDGATVHHIKTLSASVGSVHAGAWLTRIGAKGVYRGFQLTAGAGIARNESRITFTGPDARLDLSGLMLGRGNDHIDTTLVVNHTTTACESRELFKAVLDDRARAVFQGKVIVAAEAQKTDGKQMAQALMLSPDTEFDSKPELEIYADDVACGHGSTAAEIDSDMLFYLRARGIPLEEARRLLIESFATEALEKIEDDAVRGAVRELAVGWLGRADRRT
ncbi:MAG: Fe-S cluster assembly protein SufD [Hyphomicrobiaceae bacterium]